MVGDHRFKTRSFRVRVRIRIRDGYLNSSPLVFDLQPDLRLRHKSHNAGSHSPAGVLRPSCHLKVRVRVGIKATSSCLREAPKSILF